MLYFGKNIKKLRGVKGMSQQAFAELFDLKRAALGAYEEERSKPKLETVIQIANYFSISIDALLTQELTVNQLTKFKGEMTVNLSPNTAQSWREIPCITADNQAQFIQYHHKKKFIQDMPHLVLPLSDKQDWIAYTVMNLEMTQNDSGYFPNDIVLGARLNVKEISNIQDGALTLVLMEDKLILRNLYYKAQQVTLKAMHPSIEPLVVDQSKILSIWAIDAVFFKRLPKTEDNWKERVAKLEKLVSKLS